MEGTVTAIDTTTYNVKNIPVGIEPTSIFGNLTRKLIYVINPSSSSVSVFNTTDNTVIKTLPVGDNFKDDPTFLMLFFPLIL